MRVRGSHRARTGRRLWGVGVRRLACHPWRRPTPTQPPADGRRRDENRGANTVGPVNGTDATRTTAGPGPRRRAPLGGLLPWVVLGVAALAGVAAGRLGTATGEIEGVETFAHPAGLHTEADVPYTENPGTGGPHHPVWQDCGVYDAEVREEHAVHSLEHGAVWITYRPSDLTDAGIAALAERFSGRRYVIVSPRDGQQSPVVLTAWNRRLALNGPDDERIGVFVARYAEGPQAPEAGAPCEGGTAATLGTPADAAHGG